MAALINKISSEVSMAILEKRKNYRFLHSLIKGIIPWTHHIIAVRFEFTFDLDITKIMTGLLPRRAELNTRPYHTGCVLERVAAGKVLFRIFYFPTSRAFHKCPIFIHHQLLWDRP